MYHRLGAKGNASIRMFPANVVSIRALRYLLTLARNVALLLRDEMVTATVDFDFNRIAQAVSLHFNRPSVRSS